MTAVLDSAIFDDLFQACALHAWLEQAAHTGGLPESEPTRVRAYQLYEDALAERQKAFDHRPRTVV
jgi:hypothetical protein